MYISRCFGLLICPGKNVRYSDMHLLSEVGQKSRFQHLTFKSKCIVINKERLCILSLVFKYERCNIEHVTSMGQRKTLSPQRESNLRPRKTLGNVWEVMGSILVRDSDFSLTHPSNMLNISSFIHVLCLIMDYLPSHRNQTKFLFTGLHVLIDT